MSRKPVRITVRYSPEEIEKVKFKAKEMKMITSKYIRTMSLDGEAYMLVAPEYTNVMNEMTRIGTNINQIARRLNDQGSFYYDELAEIKEEHEELCRLLNQYLSTLHLKEL